MSTTDEPPEGKPTTRLIPTPLVPWLCVYLTAVGIYATVAAMGAAYGSPVPILLHNSVQFVFAVAAVAWLVALAVVKLDEHEDARAMAAARRDLVMQRRLDAVLSSPVVARALHPAGTDRRSRRRAGRAADATVYEMPSPEVRDAVTRIKKRIGQDSGE